MHWVSEVQWEIAEGKFYTPADICTCFAELSACFEPTSVAKSLKVFEHASLLETKTLSLTTPNQHELEVMAEEYKLRLGQGVSNEKSILHHFATKVKGN